MKTPRAIGVRNTPEDTIGFTIPLAGVWTEEGCHQYMKQNHPNVHSYKIKYDYVQNTSCEWSD